MSEHYPWPPPKGGDGSQSDGNPLRAIDDGPLEIGMRAFKDVCLAIKADNVDAAQSVWERSVEEMNGEADPYEIVVLVGIVLSAMALRAMCGDPNPSGAPSAQMDITAIALNKDDGSVINSESIDLAITAIGHAANWDWAKLTDLMSNQIAATADIGHFLRELASAVMSVFIGVGGVETIGWRS